MAVDDNGAAVKALIKELYDAWTPAEGERRSWAAFARYARVSEYSLTEWRSGRGAPSATNLLRLLEAVGWLDREGSQPEPVPAAPVSLMAEALENQRAMRVDLERLSDAVASLARDVAALVEQPTEQPESQRTRKKRAGG